MPPMTDQPLEPSEPSNRPAPDTAEEPPTEVQPPRPEPEPEPAAPPPPPPRRLHRSRDDRVVAGVCGGLGEYLGVDAVLFRIAFVLLVFAGGLGILAYVLGWIFLPEEPEPGRAATDTAFERVADTVGGDDRKTGGFVLGILFVGLGLVFLLDVDWPNFLSWQYVWPIALIAVGVAVILRTRR
jgi:phage shock protein C